MKKKFRQFLKDYTVFCLLLALLLGSGAFTFAEYVKSSYTRRVVASYQEGQSRFSSNYLLIWDGSTHNPQTLPLSGSASFSVQINNYPRGFDKQYYEGLITYTLSAKLFVSDGSTWTEATAADFTGAFSATTITVKMTDAAGAFTAGNDSITLSSSNLSATNAFTSTLNGLLGAKHDLLTVTYNNLPNNVDSIPFFVQLIATPTIPDDDPDIKALEGLIGFGEASETVQVSWQGGMVEAYSERDDRDGFNYRFEGNGAGTFTVKWNPDVLTLSEASRQFTLSGATVSNATAPSGWKEFAFHVDSDVVPRYEIQFYKTSASTVHDLTSGGADPWANAVVGSYVEDP